MLGNRKFMISGKTLKNLGYLTRIMLGKVKMIKNQKQRKK